MKHPCFLRTLHWFGVTTVLASLSTAALGQAANPLGVEWVGGGKDPARRAPAPAADNPLGVEWVGGGKDAARPGPAPATDNPLGVEWMGGGKNAAAPQPSPTSGVRTGGGRTPQPTSTPPAPPQPSPSAPHTPEPQPPAPVRPAPDAAPPRPGASQPSLAAKLIDIWSYQAVAFSDASGTVSETRGVSGTLKFKADGQYEQALSIGGIANVMKGSYRLVGDRLETTYLWRGESVTDSFDLYLDPTEKRLTLTGLGTPKSYYTLQRAE